MINIFRVPKDFYCPNCGHVMEECESVHDMRCSNCGELYSIEHLIGLAMLKAGILPERDWDDDL